MTAIIWGIIIGLVSFLSFLVGGGIAKLEQSKVKRDDNKKEAQKYNIEWGMNDTHILVRFHLGARGFVPGEIPYTVIDAFRKKDASSSNEPVSKGYKTTSHDELVAALRKRIDEQEKQLKVYFVRVKELEGQLEHEKDLDRTR